jgi:hypothetical protein
MEQLLLLPTEDEQTLLETSDRFRDLGEIERRFVCAWVALARKKDQTLTVQTVAKQAGISRSQGYKLWKRPEIIQSVRQAGQAHSDIADVIGSQTYDLLLEDALQKVKSGTITSTNIQPTTLRLLEGAKARLGLAPGSLAIASITNPDGSRLDAVAGSGAEASGYVAALLNKLQADGGGTVSCGFEAENVESVHVAESADAEVAE